ncbi:MAG TPA: choice-of-anchor D domain-containing protein [Terriglobia bacterium]|nr:choice-of-anchor D domain-containing protein [Terriglobia bacterium]
MLNTRPAKMSRPFLFPGTFVLLIMIAGQRGLAQDYTLSPNLVGQGTVTSTDGAINCTRNGTGTTGTCSATYASGTQVTMNATPASGWTFSAWSSGTQPNCNGGNPCIVTMTQNLSPTATFVQTTYTLSPILSGQGTVTSTDGAINCTRNGTGTSGSCSANYLSGATVTMNATAASGWTFSAWSSGTQSTCNGGNPCVVTMNQNLSPTATFTNSGTPMGTLSNTNVIFPIQAVGTTGTAQTVTLSNTGTATLTITGIALGGANAGDFTQTNNCGGSLAAGASCTFTITFTPTATGTRTASISITDNNNNVSGTVQQIALTGIGGYTLSPNLSGQGTVTSTDGAINCTRNAGGVTGTCSATYASGITVTMNATAASGWTFSAWSSGTQSGCNAGNPCIVTMTQNLSPTATFTSGTPIGTLSSTNVIFPLQAVGTTGTAQTVTLTNTGTAALTITGIALGGANAGDFAQSNNCPLSPATVAPGGLCTFTITFTPTATGTRTASISITDNNNNVSGTVQQVALTGTGGYTLSPNLSGQGTVTSTDGAINCTRNASGVTGTCSATYASGTTVMMNATAASGWTFSAWSSGTQSGCNAGNPCVVTMNQNLSPTATFGYTLTVSENGQGTITSIDGKINCTNDIGTCSYTYNSGTSVTLNTAPLSGWVFVNWSGTGCSGTNPSCTVVMNSSLSPAANFTLSYTLSPILSGQGTVTSTDGKINCTSNAGGVTGACSAAYANNTTVTMNATTTSGWKFSAWSSGTQPNCNGGNPCVVTMNQNLSPTATFKSTAKWQELTNQPSFNTDTALLLTDGTVMMHEYNSGNWWLLTPSITGSYLAGTWTQLASMQSGYEPVFFASAVMIDGKVLVEGGEYNNGSLDETNQGAIYDPTANVWTPVSPPTGWSTIGDSPGIVLPDGTFMMGQGGESSTLQVNFDESTLTWTSVTNSGKADNFSEEGFALLPDGSVLTVDTADGTNSEVYNPSTQQWTSAGSTIVTLPNSGEMGPLMQRPDGSVIAFGATTNTSIYDSSTGTWTAGPIFPNSDDIADGNATILPDGNILVYTSPGVFNPPGAFYEFTYPENTFVSAPSTSTSGFLQSDHARQLLLPTGQVLWCPADGSTTDVELYSSPGTINAAWAPTITSVPTSITRGTSYTISGTQFNGLSAGTAYGDDAQMATNFPLVRITNLSTKHVFYARTSNFSTMGIATGSTVVSASFVVPTTAETGSSSLVVVANGIASKAKKVSIK